MTLWRVEWLRLVRTGRAWIVLGVYLFFAVLGPVTARYLPEILARFGGDIQVITPEPTPAMGIAQFSSNAAQLGLLAIIVVAAGALTFDARPEWSAFLRTRVTRLIDLLIPRVVLPAAVGAAALALGTLVAAVGTHLLIGSLPTGDLVIGILLGALYLLFAVSVTAVAASVARSAISTVLLAVAVLMLLPVLQLLPTVGDWVPSRLLGATDGLLAGAPLSDLLGAVVVTVLVVPGLVAWATRRLARREL